MPFSRFTRKRGISVNVAKQGKENGYIHDTLFQAVISIKFRQVESEEIVQRVLPISRFEDTSIAIDTGACQTL